MEAELEKFNLEQKAKALAEKEKNFEIFQS